MWMEREGRRASRKKGLSLDLHSVVTVRRSNERKEGPVVPSFVHALACCLPFCLPSSLQGDHKWLKGPGEGRVHPRQGGWEGFLQEAAPGLKPDCKKSHRSPMNSGSSSQEVS